MEALVNLPGIVQRMTQDFEHEITEANARDSDRDIAMESLSSLSALRTKLERLERNAVVKLVSSGVLKAGEAAQALDVRERNIELIVNANNTPLVLAKTGVGSGRVLTPIEDLNRVIEKHNLPFALDDIVSTGRSDSGITVPDISSEPIMLKEFMDSVVNKEAVEKRAREEQKRVILELAKLCRERGADIQVMLSYPEKQAIESSKLVSLGKLYGESELSNKEITESSHNDPVVIDFDELYLYGVHIERHEGESTDDFMCRFRDLAYKRSSEPHKDGMFERFLDKTPSDYDYDRNFEKRENTATRMKMEDHLESKFGSKGTNSDDDDDGDLQDYEEDLAIVNGKAVMRVGDESFKDFEVRVARLAREGSNDRDVK